MKIGQDPKELRELKALLTGPQDRRSCVLSITAGAGGDEPQDWAGMLLEMYKKWCSRRGWRVDQVDIEPGAHVGILRATLVIRGWHVYGFCKAEHGAHRLARISPHDPTRRRHISLARVDVTPSPVPYPALPGVAPWSHAIRSYVFAPYRLIRDRRTGLEIQDIDSVMQGDLDPLVNGWVRAGCPGECLPVSTSPPLW